MAFDFGNSPSGSSGTGFDTAGFDTSGFGTAGSGSFDYSGSGSGLPSAGGFQDLPSTSPQGSGYSVSGGGTYFDSYSRPSSTGRKIKERRPKQSVDIPWKLILTLAAAIVVIVLLVAFRGVILSTLRSILSTIVMIAVVVLIIKLLFRR